MADIDTQEKDGQDNGKKKLSLARPGKLELKKTIEGGQVRQSFSHGRSKVVAVEVRKKRTFAPGASGAMREVHDEDAEAAFEAATNNAEAAAPVEQAPAEARAPVFEPHLTEHERQQRMKALQDARKADEERASRAAIEEELARQLAAEEARRKAEENALRAEQGLPPEVETPATAPAQQAEADKAKPAAVEPAPIGDEDPESEAARIARGKVAPRRPVAPVVGPGAPRRRARHLTI
jgi:translation initiation factor IF-2